MKARNLFIGVIAGIAAGALAGVLFAPDKGSVTRKKIFNRGKDYADTVSDKFSSLIDEISEKLKSVKHEFIHAKPNGEEVKKDVKSATA
jgi:gas vesicle protein